MATISLPSLGVLASRVSQLPPPSRLSSILTSVIRVADHSMRVEPPASSTSPPLGAMTEASGSAVPQQSTSAQMSQLPAKPYSGTTSCQPEASQML